MTEYTLRVKEIEVGETVEVPDSARDVEIEYFTERYEEPGIGGGVTQVRKARIKYLDKDGESVL